MTDETFAKNLNTAIKGIAGLCDWGIDKGHITPDKIRLTPTARREEAKKLINSGVSKRQTAKRLGVDESTVRADLRENPAQNAGKSRTTKTRKQPEPKPKELDQETGEDDSPPSSKQIKEAFLLRAAWAAEWAEKFSGESDDEIRSEVRRTANSWMALAEKLDRSK